MPHTTHTTHKTKQGLRLHDNPALLAAADGAARLYPVFVIDPHFLKSGAYKVGVNRYSFLLESLADLDKRCVWGGVM
jgi:cryptochrome